MYAFLTNVFQWQKTGGPQTAARNIETMLNKHASFPYQIVKSRHSDFLETVPQSSLIHVQSNRNLVEMVIARQLPLIVGPNMIWQQATKQIYEYAKMKAVFTLRPDPAVSCNAAWFDRISFFPPFVDEDFWTPQSTEKTIDVLTIGKAFSYPEFYKNQILLEQGIKKTKLKHLHLQRFSQQELKNALQKSRVIAYPSPRESGASCCHVLLEANMMNVPFIGLKSVILDENDEYNPCRGIAVDSIDEMIQQLPAFVSTSCTLHPREWTVERHSTLAAYKKICKVINHAHDSN